MRVSYQWLKEYLPVDMLPDELALHLTMLGLEVDYIEEPGRDFKGLVISEVARVMDHPGADNLKKVLVDTGSEKKWVVCGAPNVEAGQKVVYAPPGTVLPDGEQVEEVEIRGELSSGMLCSRDELNLQEERAPGIMILEPEVAVGTPVASYLGLDDHIFVLDLTPNYGYALSMVGVARELAAFLGLEVNLPTVVEEREPGKVEDILKVEIKAPELCPRYTARVLEGVKIAPSPWWMQRRLLAAGLRPVNNVVDVTNYVMLELGHPLHAFDFDCVSDKRVIVRRAQAEEVLVTLDDKERVLNPENLVIADAEKPIALAGVMGGLESEVGEETTNILLESAYFNPVNVRLTAKEFSLHNPSSHRFERGVDIENLTRASLRAAQLIVELAGAKLIGGIVDEYPRFIEPRVLRLRPQRANQILGTDIPRMEMKNILESLNYRVEDSKSIKGAFKLQVPTVRNDVEQEVDIIEDIARHFGYGEIPVQLPVLDMSIGGRSARQIWEEKIKDLMRSWGFDQVITTSLVKEEGVRLDRVQKEPMRLANPLSEENACLRQSLLPGMFDVAAFNAKRQVEEMCIFEIGKVFLPREAGELPTEEKLLSALCMGVEEGGCPWHKEASQFYILKGLMERLLLVMRLQPHFLRGERDFLHPGRQAQIMLTTEDGDELLLGFLGEIHPRLQGDYRLGAQMAVMEINMGLLLAYGDWRPAYKGVPRFPASRRDLAFVLDDSVTAAKVLALIREKGGPYVEHTEAFDLFSGEQIPPGKKSLALRIVFRSQERTLKDEDVDRYVEAVVKAANTDLGAKLRC